MVKDKCSKKKRLVTMIQQQSASRVQMPSLSSSKDREAWEAATAFWLENKGDEDNGAWRV